MDRNKLIYKIDKLMNWYLQNVWYYSYKKNYPMEAELLKNNRKYKNIHKGKRCFILGNGPSANNVDFKLLSNEYVFTVNEMMRHKNFSEIKSNYHFIADPGYFDMNLSNPTEAEVIRTIEKLGKGKSAPIVFMPIESLQFIKKFRWDGKINCAYFSSKLFYENGLDGEFCFDRFVPMFQAVVQWAIAMAAYMGFQEIYLLGCEATNVITDIQGFRETSREELYAYSLTEKEKQQVQKRHNQKGIEYSLYGYHRIFKMFGMLGEYCKERNIKLINCSPNSLISSIPKKNIENVLTRTK